MTWDETKHPRLPHGPGGGEFVHPGGWLHKLGDVITGRPAQRDLSHDEDTLDRAAAAMPGAGQWHPDGGDRTLGEIYKAQGFDAKPEVVSHDELDARVAAGWTEMWRGMSAPKFVEEFRYGDHYPGFGTHASGTYAAREVEDTQDYAGAPGLNHDLPLSAPENDAAWSAYYEGQAPPVRTWDTVTRMALRPDARVALLYGPEWEAWHDQLNDSSEELNRQVDAGGLTKDQAKLLERRHAVLQDFGRWAALKGYDAIIIPGGYGSDRGPKHFTGWVPSPTDHYAILNRGAVAVADGPAQ